MCIRDRFGEGGQLAGFRNQLINGDFRVIQRGTPAVNVDQAYQFDRWYQPGDTDQVTRGGNLGPDGFTYFAKFAAGSAARIAQYIELDKQAQPGIFALGSTWTMSYLAKCATGTESMTVQTWWSDGSSPTSTNSDLQQQPPQDIDTTWRRYSWTFTIGLTGPAASNVAFTTQIRSVSTSIGSEVQVTGVQLEPGPVATPFEHRPIGTELALCQRYYQTCRNLRLSPQDITSTGREISIPRYVIMRVDPTEAGTASGSLSSVNYLGKTENLRITGQTSTSSQGAQINNYTADAEL